MKWTWGVCEKWGAPSRNWKNKQEAKTAKKLAITIETDHLTELERSNEDFLEEGINHLRKTSK